MPSLDYAWLPEHGGIFLDPQGDIATVDPSIRDVVVSRLKAAANGWEVYPGMGADLQSSVGRALTAELELTVIRKAEQALTKDGFLPKSLVSLRTIQSGNVLMLFVFLPDDQSVAVKINSDTGVIEGIQ